LAELVERSREVRNGVAVADVTYGAGPVSAPVEAYLVEPDMRDPQARADRQAFLTTLFGASGEVVPGTDD
jgi:hypothetical protein